MATKLASEMQQSQRRMEMDPTIPGFDIKHNTGGVKRRGTGARAWRMIKESSISAAAQCIYGKLGDNGKLCEAPRVLVIPKCDQMLIMRLAFPCLRTYGLSQTAQCPRKDRRKSAGRRNDSDMLRMNIKLSINDE